MRSADLRPPPRRDPPRPVPDAMELALHEYDAIRGEIEVALGNQQAAINFGSATVGLLTAAAASFWNDEHALAGALLLGVVPGACFFAVALWLSDLARLLRAAWFMYDLECWLNAAARQRVLVWEDWVHIREGASDLERHNWRVVGAVFGSLAGVAAVAGGWRLLSSDEISEEAARAAIEVSLVLVLGGVAWLHAFARRARAYRDAYRDARNASLAR